MPGANEYRMAFYRFLLEAGALQFGNYTLKSGRISPYFFNSGRFDTGGYLERLGGYYARAIQSRAPKATLVFGPAYKGVPLCVAAAMALEREALETGPRGSQAPQREEGCRIGYLFDRKEEKGHGDRGAFVGRPPQPGEHLVMVDDVITDGETKLEAVRKLREAFDVSIDALVIAFDRMEVSATGGDAVRRFEEATGVPVVSLMTLTDLEATIEESFAMEADQAPAVSGNGAAPTREMLERIRVYRRQYGIESAERAR